MNLVHISPAGNAGLDSTIWVTRSGARISCRGIPPITEALLKVDMIKCLV